MSARRARLVTGGVAALIIGTVLMLALPTQAALLSGASPGSDTPKQTDSEGLSVELRPQNASIEPDGTITYAVVASGVDGGVGAYNLSLTLGDGSAADITAVELAGDPGLTSVTFGSNNDTVRLVVSLADTADSGTVTIANVTVAGESEGETAVDLSVVTVANESGNAYTLGPIRDASLVVGSPSTETTTPTATSTATTTAAPTSAPGTTTTKATPTPTSTATAEPTTTTSEPTTTAVRTTAEETTAETTSAPPTTTTSGDGGPGFTIVVTVITFLMATLYVTTRSD